jgi:ABC-type lipoprotein export system ATPase subunit
MNAPLVRLSSVTKVYGRGETELRALDKVDLEIKEG